MSIDPSLSSAESLSIEADVLLEQTNTPLNRWWYNTADSSLCLPCQTAYSSVAYLTHIYFIKQTGIQCKVETHRHLRRCWYSRGRRAGDVGVLSVRSLVAANRTAAVVLALIIRHALLRSKGLSIRSSPRGNFPHATGEGLDLEASLLPFSTRLPRTVEGTETGIDGTLVGFRAEFVGGCYEASGFGSGGSAIESAVLTSMQHVSIPGQE